MSRVINPNTSGKSRTQLTKAIVLAIRELMQQTTPDDTSRDLAAFIVGALEEIARGVDTSVVAWEKRDYWVKADRFRAEWTWTKHLAEQMRAALLADDWLQVAALAVRIAHKLGNVEVSARHRMGKPWIGAWKALQRQDAERRGDAPRTSN